MSDLLKKNSELQAKVEELTRLLNDEKDIVACLRSARESESVEIEQLRMAIGLLTTLKGDMLIRPNKPMAMAEEIVQYVELLRKQIERLSLMHNQNCSAVKKPGAKCDCNYPDE